jgi:hypothetical protein
MLGGVILGNFIGLLNFCVYPIRRFASIENKHHLL